MKFKKALNEADDKLELRKDYDIAMEKFHHGKMNIEFMIPRGSNIPVLLVYFDDNLRSMMAIKSDKVMRFNTPEELRQFIYNSMGARYQFSDLKAVAREFFNHEEMNDVFDQITKYIDSYPAKARSLTYNKSHAKPGEQNSEWDMEVVFRRSMEKWSKESGNWRIHPAISGANEVGKIIGKNEIEVR